MKAIMGASLILDLDAPFRQSTMEMGSIRHASYLLANSLSRVKRNGVIACTSSG